jgi:RimJ/RimL family protein N-acetyltransferase
LFSGEDMEFMGAMQLRYSFGEYMIRDWRDDDATSLARYANNRKIWSNLRDGFPYPYARDDAALFISRALQKEPKTAFAIASKSEAIGSIGLMPGQRCPSIHRRIRLLAGRALLEKGDNDAGRKSIERICVQ